MAGRQCGSLPPIIAIVYFTLRPTVMRHWSTIGRMTICQPSSERSRKGLPRQISYPE